MTSLLGPHRSKQSSVVPGLLVVALSLAVATEGAKKMSWLLLSEEGQHHGSGLLHAWPVQPALLCIACCWHDSQWLSAGSQC